MVRDTLLIFRAELAVSLRNKAFIVIGMMQPVLYLVLFGPLMEKLAASTPGFGPGKTWMVLTPGLIVQIALLNASFAGYSILTDQNAGVLERLRVTPSSRAALMLGKVLTIVVSTLFQAVLLIVIASLLFDVSAPAVGIVVCLVIAALLSLTLATLSNSIALRMNNETAFSAVLNVLLLPIVLLSGILLPITPQFAPTWLFVLSRLNPLSYVVDISRASFTGDLPPVGVALGALMLFGIAALAVWWGARTFQRETR
ncbi:ABC transporter permease [Amycolatopsis sp. SID8362]|uniref:ABC transporter permease n=1 Tax=Amycolatopsis sp. SID8362 TaxID=2690346 RepID=UPI00136D8D36|nr:ABC transporter permease [Amycolatopsis sp. SID8362]NBH06453.1 ABC transporter permease [Amycolatopsis sp. SID8362]NED43151.1 ABC transporter permease [Amycolatopsis sp. SID8362]